MERRALQYIGSVVGLSGTRRGLAGWLLTGATACGPSLLLPEGDLGDGSSEDGSSTVPGALDSGSTTTDPGDSTTGSPPPTPTLAPTLTYGWAECTPTDPMLFTMSFVDGRSITVCENPGGFSTDLLVAGIRPWDGEAGTFAVSESGPGYVALGDGSSQAGTLRLEVSAPWQPTFLTVEAMTSDGPISYILDVGTCYEFEGPPDCG